jgi:hypothetical protein
VSWFRYMLQTAEEDKNTNGREWELFQISAIRL